MKTKLRILFSILSFRENVTLKNNRIKESLLNLAEEAGAWLLLAGVLMGIFWLAGIVSGAQVN